jgi:hypothetical protein
MGISKYKCATKLGGVLRLKLGYNLGMFEGISKI